MRRTAVLLGPIVVLVAVWLGREGPLPWPGSVASDPWTLVAAALVVLGGPAVLATRRAVRVGGVVALVLGSVVLGDLVVERVGRGLPGPATGALAAGTAVTLVGVIGLVVVGGSGPRPGWGVAAVTALVVALLAVGGALAADEVAVHSTTADGPGSDEPVVLRPGAPRWSWRAPDRVDAVVPVTGGVVVRHGASGESDGYVLTALDGATGAPRWSFRRGTARVDRVVASPDGRSLVVVHQRPQRDLDRPYLDLVTVLDAATGARRWDATVSTLDLQNVTDTVLTTVEPEEGRRRRAGALVARSLDDGHEAWTYAPQEGCRLEEQRGDPEIRYDAVVVAVRACDDITVLTGLDPVTGLVRWTRPPQEHRSGRISVVSAPDASRVLVVQQEGRTALLDPSTGATVAEAPELTGRRYGEPAESGAVLPLVGSSASDPVVEAADPDSGVVVPLAPDGVPPCRPVANGGVAVTARATVRLCAPPGPARTTGVGVAVRVDAGPAVPVDLGRPLPGAVAEAPPEYRLRPGAWLVPAPGAVVVVDTRTEPSVVVGLGPG